MKIKTMYEGYNADGIGVYFLSKEPVINCKQASEICGEEIVRFGLAPLFWQLFPMFRDTAYKRPKKKKRS